MGQVTDASTDSANLSDLSSSRARFLGGALAAALPRWRFALLDMLWRAPSLKPVPPLELRQALFNRLRCCGAENCCGAEDEPNLNKLSMDLSAAAG